MQPKFSGIYLVRMPFMELGVSKLRPVIVVSKPQGSFNIVCVVPISSQPRTVDVDLDISDWQDAGLSKPSIARVHRLATILQSDLTSEIGALSTANTKTLKQRIKKYFQL
jgi:mRNA interferase MazF